MPREEPLFLLDLRRAVLQPVSGERLYDENFEIGRNSNSRFLFRFFDIETRIDRSMEERHWKNESRPDDEILLMFRIV